MKKSTESPYWTMEGAFGDDPIEAFNRYQPRATDTIPSDLRWYLVLVVKALIERVECLEKESRNEAPRQDDT